MSLLTDLSGVNAAQTDIDTVGNNIANVNTTAFKVSDAQFSALYGNALSAAPGQGVNTADLAQSFNEGSVSQTGRPLDVAITGNGFFQLQSGSGIVYSRDGSFQISSSGNWSMPAGLGSWALHRPPTGPLRAARDRCSRSRSTRPTSPRQRPAI